MDKKQLKLLRKAHKVLTRLEHQVTVLKERLEQRESNLPLSKSELDTISATPCEEARAIRENLGIDLNAAWAMVQAANEVTLDLTILYDAASQVEDELCGVIV